MGATVQFAAAVPAFAGHAACARGARSALRLARQLGWAGDPRQPDHVVPGGGETVSRLAADDAGGSGDETPIDTPIRG
jgi:hypothetical protein